MKKTTVAGLILAGLGGLGIILVINFTAVFSVSGVKVSGTNSVTAQRIRDVADVRLGQTLARVDVGAITSAINESVPDVTAVSVQRRWPHTVQISVRDRTVAANVTTGGKIRRADADGVIFGSVNRPKKGATKVVLIPSFDAQSTSARQSAIVDCLTVYRALPSKVRKAISRVEYRSGENITLVLTSGKTIRWGSAVDSARKAQVLSVLLGRRASVYDVSSPDLPVTKG